MVRRGHSNQVSDRTSMAAARRAKAERASGRGAVAVTGAEPALLAGHAATAGHLERHQHALADPPLGYLISYRGELGHELVPDGKRAREDPLHRHGLIKITAGYRQWSYQGPGGIDQCRGGDLLPLDSTWLNVAQLAHLIDLVALVPPLS
jgi:hypothetical protein